LYRFGSKGAIYGFWYSRIIINLTIVTNEARVMRVYRTDRVGGQFGRQNKSGGSSNCVTHLKTFAGHGDEAQVLPRRRWGTIHRPRGIVPRNQSSTSPSYFVYANALRRGVRKEERERERERENSSVTHADRRRDGVCENLHRIFRSVF